MALPRKVGGSAYSLTATQNPRVSIRLEHFRAVPASEQPGTPGRMKWQHIRMAGHNNPNHSNTCLRFLLFPEPVDSLPVGPPALPLQLIFPSPLALKGTLLREASHRFNQAAIRPCILH